MKALVFAMLLCPSLATAEPRDDAAWRASLDAWKQKRLQSIAGEDGWITLVGLLWLHPGENRFGADPKSELHLPSGPPIAGSIFLEGDRLRLQASAQILVDGKAVTTLALRDDRDGGEPTVMTLGSLTMRVIKRQDRWALRVKDRAHPARKTFAGLSYYPPDPSLRVRAKLLPAAPGKALPIANVLGQVERTPTPGTLQFSLDGVAYTLDPVREAGEDELFIIFRDRTSGHGTYPSGRFLYAPLPAADGSVELDFNRAFNPPCAFTAFATCPLPPPQNALPRKIEAGERHDGQHP